MHPDTYGRRHVQQSHSVHPRWQRSPRRSSMNWTWSRPPSSVSRGERQSAAGSPRSTRSERSRWSSSRGGTSTSVTSPVSARTARWANSSQRQKPWRGARVQRSGATRRPLPGRWSLACAENRQQLRIHALRQQGLPRSSSVRDRMDRLLPSSDSPALSLRARSPTSRRRATSFCATRRAVSRARWGTGSWGRLCLGGANRILALTCRGSSGNACAAERCTSGRGCLTRGSDSLRIESAS